MKAAKIFVGTLLVIIYIVPTVAYIIALFSVDTYNMSEAIGNVVGAGLVLFIGTAMLVSGIRNRKFTQAFTSSIKTPLK